MQISNLKDSDIGRCVIYRRQGADQAVGVISSWNEWFVFVRYGGKTQASQATSPEDLCFNEEPGPKEVAEGFESGSGFIKPAPIQTGEYNKAFWKGLEPD